ncbi:MAG: CehA/McbA family metallohydrolase [Candidatus Eisenbacteria bacterium]
MGQLLPLRGALRALPAVAALSAALLLAPGMASAAIFINEILPNPLGAETGLDEKVEIYNSGPNAVDLTGWAIDDAVTIGTAAVRARIPEDFDAACGTSAIILPGEFRVVHINGSAALNNGGDDVYLVSDRLTSATVVQLVTYPAIGDGAGSWACLPNGTTSFALRASTICASNGGPIGDVTPPATVSDLLAAPGQFPGEIRLTWTAPGDDDVTGTATNYVIKVSHSPIATVGDFNAAADLDHWILEPAPHASATPETLFVFGLDPDSTWHFALQTQDEVPNNSAISNDSGTLPLAGALPDPNLGFTPYYGNLHSHSSYSDGVQTPTAAYTYARASAPTPLDFLAVTDHNHVSAGMQLPNYALGAAEAASANSDGDFVAIWGQEWGIIATGGHINVFEAPVLFGWDPGQHDVFVAEGDYTGLYTALRANPPANHAPFVEFCHPSGGDFNSYALTADAQAVVSLMAMVSGPAFSTSTTESDVGSSTGNEILFQDALRKGFRVSPTADQDNHNATWGASTEGRTAVLTSGKTKSQIMAGLAAGRCYATQDHNVVVQFAADGRPMGSAWTSGTGIQIAAQITDPDVTDSVVGIDIMRGITGTSNAVVVASSVGNANLVWRERQTFAVGTEAHYYLRIRMADNQTVWTGPVYVTYDPAAVTGVDDGVRPEATFAMQARPNPMMNRVTASFTLSHATDRADLAVYDASGRRVTTLINGPLAAGQHSVDWTGQDDFGHPSPAGIYFLRVNAGQRQATQKVLLLK